MGPLAPPHPPLSAVVPSLASFAVVLAQGLEPEIGESDCERLRDGLVAQPVNTWSSLAFVVVAVAIVAITRRERRALGRLLGVLLVATGLGSMAFHGPQPGPAGWLHDVPIASLVGFVLLAEVGLRRSGPADDPGPARRWTLGAALALAAGIVCWAAGRTDGLLCSPDSVVQLHAVWHVLAATTLGCWWRSWSLRSP